MEPTWLWLVIGLILLTAELLLGTFVLIFFGLGGLVTALLAFLWNVDWPLQITVFALTSTLLLLLFRKHFLKPASSRDVQRALSSDIGAQIVLTTRIPARGEGSVPYQGSPWTAVNTEETDLEIGEVVRVTHTEGVRLFVKRASP